MPRKLSRFVRVSVVLALECGLTITPRAAFPQTLLQDFYNGSGAQGNMTPAGVYQTANLNLVTGGGFVYKTPNAGFRPWSFTPPSLRMGCGNIDFFLGGFSVPSRAEFISFLRKIGTALPGLAFQLALQSLSPDLEKQVSEFRQLLMKLSAENISSCEAAKWLLDNSGATEAIQTAGQSAREYMNGSGETSDDSESREKVRQDGGAIRANCGNTERRDDNGEVREGCEINLTWALLSGGNYDDADSVQVRRFIMTLLGPIVLRWVGDGADSRLKELEYEQLRIPFDLVVGRVDSNVLQKIKWYDCADDYVYCLDPVQVDFNDVSLANKVYEAVDRYRRSVIARDRTLVTQQDLFLLASSTSVPLLRLTSVLATARYRDMADNVLMVYAEGAAYDLAMRFLNQMATTAWKVVAGKQAAPVSSRIRKHAELMIDRIKAVKEEIARLSQRNQQQMASMHNYVTVVEHIERALSGNLAADLSANLHFAQVVRH